MSHDWRWLVGLSLVHGPLHAAVLAVAGAALAVLVALGRGRSWWTRALPAAGAGAAVLLGVAAGVLALARPFPDPLPAAVWAEVGAGLLGVALAVAVARRRRWWVRLAAGLAATVVVAGAADAVDAEYGSFPTLSAALQLRPAGEVPPSVVLADGVAAGATPTRAWSAPELPAHGAIAEVPVPAPRSGFPARPAWVYVPPVYLVPGHPRLPLLVLVHGQPGGPRDWVDAGRVAARLDRWAAAHGGLAPVVLMPDATGGEVANPLCTDSPRGRADTYLARDVPAWVDAHLAVDPDHAHWAVGGFSYGGTCALQLATAHPDLFPTVLDESGQREPTLGDHAGTVATVFGGDEAAFDAADPLHELAARRHPGTAATFVVGAGDRVYVAEQRDVVAAARAAGMDVRALELPGGHTWDVWGTGLEQSLPWLCARLGLSA
jgi:enterochelin esterase-like enzyme